MCAIGGTPGGSNKPISDSGWVSKFLYEKSGVSDTDETIQEISKTILATPTLKALVKGRYLDGKRFIGWTKDGSKGTTDMETGNIEIGKTGKGTESFTLAYECINSQNQKLYRKLAIKYAGKPDNPKNRSKFADAMIKYETQALYTKCKLADEMGMRAKVKEHYWAVFDRDDLEESEKIEELETVMREKGVVHQTLPVHAFYSGEFYESTVLFYKKKINDGEITPQGEYTFEGGMKRMIDRHQKEYKAVHVDYAYKKVSAENRQKFADELLLIEARVLYEKCQFASENGYEAQMGKKFMDIYHRKDLNEEEKINFLEKELRKFKVNESFENHVYNNTVLVYRDKIIKGEMS